MAAVVKKVTAGPRRFSERAGALLRDVALDATVELVRRNGWAQTRMADIAVRAGISKPTLYKYFGTKEELAGAYADREVSAILDVARATLDKYPDDPERALREGLREVLEATSANPLIRAILTEDAAAASLLPILTTHGARILHHAANEFAGMLRDRLHWTDEDENRAYADTLVRVIVSHAIVPGTSVDESVDMILRVALPVIRQQREGQK